MRILVACQLRIEVEGLWHNRRGAVSRVMHEVSPRNQFHFHRAGKRRVLNHRADAHRRVASGMKRGASQVAPAPRIQRGMKEVPLTPIARRLAHPSSCRKQASRRVWVASAAHRVGFASPEQSENTQLHGCVNQPSQYDGQHVAHNSMKCARPHLRSKEAEAIAQTSSSHSAASAGTAEIHAA